MNIKDYALIRVMMAVGLLIAISGGANAQQAERRVVEERVKAIYADVARAYPDDSFEMDEEDKPHIDLDGQYCSEEWKKLVNLVVLIDNAAPHDIGFFDADYWIMGQDWHGIAISNVKAQVVDATHAKVNLLLHNAGNKTPVILMMVKEQGEWKIDDFAEDDGLRSWKANMQEYVLEAGQENRVMRIEQGLPVLTIAGNLLAKAASEQLTVLRAHGRTGEYLPIGQISGQQFLDKEAIGNPYNYYYKVVDSNGQVLLSTSLNEALFGPNVLVYNETDDMAAIGEEVNAIHEQMFHDQFSANRYAVLFMPGDYRKAGLLKVPYYMHIAGLGKVPYSVQLSNIHTPAPLRDDNGTCTFWRSAENLSVIGPETYEEEETFKWAVSQAAPLRRIYSSRTLRTQWGHGWVSGGFAADCRFDAPAGSDHQQQWYYRNSVLAKGRGEYKEEKYNYCFQGVELGAEADLSTYRDNWSEGGNVTFIETTPVVREKPFLFMGDDGRYKVFCPVLKHESKGLSYTQTFMGEGKILDVLDDFYVMQPGDEAKMVNYYLNEGKHLLVPPGMYVLEEPLHVTKPGTIVLGLGYATLIPGEHNGDTAIKIDDIDGVTIASLMFDAHYSSHSLLVVGDKPAQRHEANPVLLADLFFRIGGFRAGEVCVDESVVINSHDVIGDHFWIWRADHGVRGSVGWTINRAPNGLVVNGDHVTLYGLFNEHFQEYQTLWNGNYGRTYFFQCETPYDAPNQQAYLSEGGKRDGYAAYKVASHVQHHYATAFGIYDVLVNEIRVESSVEVPEGAADIHLHHICNNSLSDPPNRGFGFVVNNRIKSTYNTFRDNRTYLVDW